MPKSVLLVRHGESWSNVAKTFACRTVDPGLTQRGLHESLRVAQWLRGQNVSDIYSSPLRRATETASEIAHTLGLRVVIIDGFREVDVGILEGHSSCAKWKAHDHIVDAWKQGQWQIAFPNGENFHGLMDRARTALHDVVASSSTGGAVVITHGALLLAIRYGLCGETIATDTPTGSVTQVLVMAGRKASEFQTVGTPQIGHLAFPDCSSDR